MTSYYNPHCCLLAAGVVNPVPPVKVWLPSPHRYAWGTSRLLISLRAGESCVQYHESLSPSNAIMSSIQWAMWPSLALSYASAQQRARSMTHMRSTHVLLSG